jgi:nitrogen fixation/metabolism regulation signal transduction histidine kinase
MHLKEKAGSKLPETEQRLIEKIIDTINHLTTTVDQVMNFARPARLSQRRLDLNLIVREVLQLAEPQLAAAHIETELTLQEDEKGATILNGDLSLEIILDPDTTPIQ